MTHNMIDAIRLCILFLKHWLHIYPKFSAIYKTNGFDSLGCSYQTIPSNFNIMRFDLNEGKINMPKLHSMLKGIGGTILNRYDFMTVDPSDAYPDISCVLSHRFYPLFLFCKDGLDECVFIYPRLLQNSKVVKKYVDIVLDQYKESEQEDESTPKISLLAYGLSGFYTREFELPKLNSDIKYNYSDKVWEDFEFIEQELRHKTHGLVLLSGIPGGGKTNAIRYLCGSLQEDFNVLLVQPEIAKNIGDVSFQNFLIDLTNGSEKKYILVFEDAENLLSPDASGVRNSAVTNILNITDGIVGDILQVRIICTFNTDYSKIDSALRRKGRLIKHIEVNELNSTEIANWCEFNNVPVPNEQAISLADLYAYKEDYLNNNLIHQL